jgi:hypothetical protein
MVVSSHEQVYNLYLFLAKAFRLKGEGFRAGEWKNKLRIHPIGTYVKIIHGKHVKSMLFFHVKVIVIFFLRI